MEKKIGIEKTGITTGLVVFLFLVAYFMVMRYLGLIRILELRLLNFVFLFTGIILALKKYKDGKGQKLGWYLEGIGVGAVTCLASVLPFSAFMCVYLNIDNDFMEYIQQHSIAGGYLTPFTASLGVAIEGLSSGMVFTFICMQYFKKYVSVTEGSKKIAHRMQ